MSNLPVTVGEPDPDCPAIPPKLIEWLTSKIPAETIGNALADPSHVGMCERIALRVAVIDGMRKMVNILQDQHNRQRVASRPSATSNKGGRSHRSIVLPTKDQSP